MKTLDKFFAPILGALFLVTSFFAGCFPNANAQITPPYYNPANVRITGGTINGTTIGATTPTAITGTFIKSTGNNAFPGAIASVGNAQYYSSNQYGSVIYGRGSINDITLANYNGTSAISIPAGTVNVNVAGTLQVGSGSGTSAGLIAGYYGASGYGAIWSTSITPGLTNFALVSNGGNSYINGTSNAGIQIGNSDILSANSAGISVTGNVTLGKTITAPGTTGAVTINKTSGRVNFAAAATSLVVTNSLATANSICHVTKATNDATMRLGACVAAAGSITIYADVAPSAETAVNFTVTN